MKRILPLILLLFIYTISWSQTGEEDSTKTLETANVRAFEQNRRINSISSIVKIIERNNSDRLNKTSLVNGFNTIAGVRMEERSPGSYRINIRGSSLRSPFGVRNVKVYWNEIPVTDAGGNSYFNQFAFNNFSHIEIFKGPASSLYGAGTGGLILLNNFLRWEPGFSLEYIGGSYGLSNLFTSARFGEKENRNQLSYAHNSSDGYRTQTRMRRDNFTWQSFLKISDNQQLSASLFYTDMYYQTPGALTLAEYNTNPKQARPAGGGFPSAVSAKAAIYQKNLIAGFTNIYKISSHFSNSTTLFGSFNQIKNPAIRNYERRKEPNLGGRTFFTYKSESVRKSNGYPVSTFQLVAGSEFQAGYYNTLVSKNKNGNPDTVLTNDDIRNTGYSFFLQSDLKVSNWYLTAGVSGNQTNVEFTRLSNYPVSIQERKYRNEWAPRLAIKKFFENRFSISATVSRGFSPPTIAELLPSTGVISTGLEAEYGWNYEMTAAIDLFRNFLRLEATAFYFKLNNALVQRRDLSGADFFVNAGDLKEKGLEITSDFTMGFPKTIFDYVTLQASFTANHFRYGAFKKGTDDFSGKIIPSVPSNTLSILFDLNFRPGIYSNATYYAASRIYLNDANTASASAYHLLGWRLGWKKLFKKKYRLNFYAGADNLLDEKYSLGNDINAAANRFYNAAPGRNYYAGVSFQWIYKKK